MYQIFKYLWNPGGLTFETGPQGSWGFWQVTGNWPGFNGSDNSTDGDILLDENGTVDGQVP